MFESPLCLLHKGKIAIHQWVKVKKKWLDLQGVFYTGSAPVGAMWTLMGGGVVDRPG